MKKSIILLLLILCSCANSNPKVEKKNISKITDKFIFTNGECLRDNVKIYYSSFNRGDILEIVDEDEGYDYGYNSIWDTDYSTEITLDDLVSEYNVTVSPLIIGEIYVLGLGIVLISILVPSLMIMRFNPKKILMNQN